MKTWLLGKRVGDFISHCEIFFFVSNAVSHGCKMLCKNKGTRFKKVMNEAKILVFV